MNELINKALKLEEDEDFIESYELWKELALKYNAEIGWEMLSNHLYSGKSYKSKPAALFCSLKAIRLNCEEEFIDSLLFQFRNNKEITEQLNKIKNFINYEDNDCEECPFYREDLDCNKCISDNYKKSLNELVDQLENIIYGSDKPTRLEQFTIN